MAVRALIDTGAILALLDRDDEWHRPCVEAFNATLLPLLTTEAVLTEVFHLTKRDARDIQGVWTLLRSGSVKLAAITDEELPEIHSLMTKYSDRPMDFADATLVYLAARESLSLILTVDHDDFETYRIGGRKRFSILPNLGVR
jgi:predicted nucleic acid-binding protein